MYEYEQTTHDRDFLASAGGTIAFGGSGGIHNDSGDGYSNSEGDSQRVHQNPNISNGGSDGGSGSTIKKESKKDKIKNFFKKHTTANHK